MSDRRSERQRLVGEALAPCAASRIDILDARCWRMLLGNDASKVVVDARLDDAWLCLSAPAPPDSAAASEELLACNAELRGGVKLVWRGKRAALDTAPTETERCDVSQGPLWKGPADAEVQLCAEVPLDGTEPMLRHRVAQACVGFAVALGVEISVSDLAVDGPDLSATLLESGWPIEERPDGSFIVDLGIPDAFFQARIALGEGATGCAAELANVSEAHDVCRRAAALLLLRAAAVVRMVRPVLAEDGALRFEVAWDGAPEIAEIHHALSALAVACRFFGREVDSILRSETVATRYCATRDGGRAAVASIG